MHFWVYFHPKGIQLIHWNSTNQYEINFLSDDDCEPSFKSTPLIQVNTVTQVHTLLALGHFSKLKINYIMDSKTKLTLLRPSSITAWATNQGKCYINTAIIFQTQLWPRRNFLQCTSNLSPGGTKQYAEPSAPIFWNLEYRDIHKVLRFGKFHWHWLILSWWDTCWDGALSTRSTLAPIYD